jgi:predicted nucleic acid-binding protein
VKAAGILPIVRPVVDALTKEAGFRISQALLAKVLESAGE